MQSDPEALSSYIVLYRVLMPKENARWRDWKFSFVDNKLHRAIGSGTETLFILL